MRPAKIGGDGVLEFLPSCDESPAKRTQLLFAGPPALKTLRLCPKAQLLKRCHDLVVVIGGVALLARLPHDLLAVDGVAVDHRGDLAIRGSEIEADAAAVQVAPEGPRGLALLGDLCRFAGHYGEGLLEAPLAHEAAIELALPPGAVAGAEMAPTPADPPA